MDIGSIWLAVDKVPSKNALSWGKNKGLYCCCVVGVPSDMMLWVRHS